MLEDFAEDIPHLEDLRPTLQELIADPRKDLDDVSTAIIEHILDQRSLDVDSREYDEARSEAWSLAMNAMSVLIADLDVNEVNCRRIKAWISGWNDFNAYDRLLTDFAHLLSPDERRRITAEGKKAFVEELTVAWD